MPLRALLLVLIILSASSVAKADTTSNAVIGGSCDTLGVSMLSSDQQNIVACLKNKSGALIWKAMSGGGGFGVDQTWKNVTASRGCGVTYRNTNDKPIQINLFETNGDGNGIWPTVDGVTVPMMSGYSGGTNMTGVLTVPAGSSYSIPCGSGYYRVWLELS